MLEKRKKQVTNKSKVKSMIKQTRLQLVAPTRWVTWQHLQPCSSVTTYNYKWKMLLSTKLCTTLKAFSGYVGATPVCKQDPGSTSLAQATPHAGTDAFFRQISSVL